MDPCFQLQARWGDPYAEKLCYHLYRNLGVSEAALDQGQTRVEIDANKHLPKLVKQGQGDGVSPDEVYNYAMELTEKWLLNRDEKSTQQGKALRRQLRILGHAEIPWLFKTPHPEFEKRFANFKKEILKSGTKLNSLSYREQLGKKIYQWMRDPVDEQGLDVRLLDSESQEGELERFYGEKDVEDTLDFPRVDCFSQARLLYALWALAGLQPVILKRILNQGKWQKADEEDHVVVGFLRDPQDRQSWFIVDINREKELGPPEDGDFFQPYNAAQVASNFEINAAINRIKLEEKHLPNLATIAEEEQSTRLMHAYKATRLDPFNFRAWGFLSDEKHLRRAKELKPYPPYDSYIDQRLSEFKK